MSAQSHYVMPEMRRAPTLNRRAHWARTWVTYDRFKEDREAIANPIILGESGGTLVPPFRFIRMNLLRQGLRRRIEMNCRIWMRS